MTTAPPDQAAKDMAAKWARYYRGGVFFACLTVMAAMGVVGHSYQALGNRAPQQELVESTEFERGSTIRRHDHDSSFFTQGLFVHNGTLFEGTGMRGHSLLVKLSMPLAEVPGGGAAVDPKVEHKVPLESRFFGEGICGIDGGNKIIQLTWQKKTYFIYDAETFEEVARGSFSTKKNQGWGITPWRDGEEVIVSDGSETLHFWGVPELLGETPRQIEIKRVQVKDPVSQLTVQKINELETIGNRIYANLWYEDYIVEIDPDEGIVTKWLDFRRLWPHTDRPRKADCLNGIAYDEDKNEVILTGKYWPHYFVMTLEEFLSHAGPKPPNHRFRYF